MRARWQQVKEILHSALERPSDERAAFLDRVCGGDSSLRREVETLLMSSENVGSFMEQGAIGKVAEKFISAENNLKIGEQLNHYKILSYIGAGGMGEIYLAEDTRLDRRVAVKILNEKFSRDESNLRRFIREAKAASALNHPNILIVHEIGEAGDVHYIASEFVEGKTLRGILNQSALKLSEILDISIQIASALTAAHAAHIIHRDIKPENVMVRPDGYAKVLDFGLAKLVEQKKSLIGLEDETIEQIQTAAGVILGTVRYMSPEQARGERVDERTDIFSFGLMLYEMVAGRTPFAGRSMSESLANLINADPPQPLARYAQNVPAELQRIVSKMLKKEKDERYQTMKDILTDLKSLRETLAFDQRLEQSYLPGDANTTVNSSAATTAAGEPNNRTDGTNNALTRRIKRHKPLAVFAFAALLFGAIGFGYYFSSTRKSAFSAAGKKSVAVLPFANASRDPNAEYLAEGITESVINNLSQLSSLKVMSKHSSFLFKDNQGDTKNIASKLGVENLVTGDIRQIGDRLVINVRLIDAGDDSQIWGNQYVKTSADVISMQNEIARDVSRKLGTRLTGADERNLAKIYTENPEAYQLFLRARYHGEKFRQQDTRKALEYLQQAIALDPNFAVAYAHLAGSYAILAGGKDFPLRETVLKAKENALKAISLDDQISTAHEILGYILWNYDYDFVAAEREFKRALEIDPNDSSARETYGGLLRSLGRQEEALAEVRKAAELNPLSPSINSSVGITLLSARRYDEAVAQLKKSLELDANFLQSHDGLADAYLMQRNYAESVEERAKMAEILGDGRAAAFIRESFAAGGWQGFLRAMTENSQAPRVPPIVKAVMYAELGNKDKAFEILNSLYEERSPRILGIKTNPRFDPLRDDPRFEELLRKVGFP